MRKLLCGIAIGILVLALPAAAHAVEADGEPTLSRPEAAEEVHHIGEEAGLDEEVIHCLEAAVEENRSAACQEAPNPIMPEINEVIWGAIAFFVLFGLIAWKGYPAIKGAMDARAQKISDDLEAAERSKVEQETVLTQYQAQLADARTEASRIIEEARVQAEQVRRDLIAKAEAEAIELRQRNAEQVAAERGRVMGEMQDQVAALAIELAEKVVESSLDRDTNTRLIESYISSVGAR